MEIIGYIISEYIDVSLLECIYKMYKHLLFIVHIGQFMFTIASLTDSI